MQKGQNTPRPLSLSQLLFDMEEKIHREKIRSEGLNAILADLTKAHELVGTDYEK